MLWSEGTIESLDTAAAAAWNGKPTAMAVEGEAGFGKSTLLEAAAERLDGFHLLRAYGEQNAQDDPFQLLYEWNTLRDDAGPPRHTLQAVRLLAQVVDRLQITGPVAFVLDDLQWIDPESVDVVVALVRRAAGDRLLALAAHRPLGRRHPAWRRLVGDTLRLDGLDRVAATALLAELQPAAPPALAEQLRVHTGGSPLYMRALLQEHSVRELVTLAARDELPAPADLAAVLDARIAKLAPDAAQLLRALAVLGDAWADPTTAAAVGGVQDVDAAVAVLRSEALLRFDHAAVAPRLRIVHAVIRAAVYEVIPPDVRRRLHQAAAARVTGTGTRLQHRLAASPRPDEGLAADLDRHADQLHHRALFREAARFRRLAARVASTEPARRRRNLDADFDAILAHDDHDDHHDESVLDESSDAQQRLVVAMRLSATKQWVRAARVLDVLGSADIAALDPVNAYRARVLRGWTIIGAGRPPAEALTPLREAAQATVRDTALQGIFTFAYGQAMQATTDHDGTLWGFHDTMAIDRATLAATPEGRVRLSWRGSAYALTGSTTKAIGDLTLVTDLINEGAMDLGDGAFHALLGLAQWAAGHWRRAAITLELAQTTPRTAAHPVVPSISPLAALVVDGDLQTCLTRSRNARLAGPHPSALHAGDITEVAVLAYAGTPQQRRDYRPQRIADFGDPQAQATGLVPHLWLLAMGLASAWAADADATDAWADALAGLSRGAWRSGAVKWLRALARQTRGVPAADQLAAAAVAGLPDLPSFEALLWIDAANAATEGHPHAAARARERAHAALRAPEAIPYVTALLPVDRLDERTDGPLAPLSQREREVAALLLEGLSYSQIAKELFVTRSTIAFHLSNTYAKTGTSTRHELVEILRPTHQKA